MAAIRVNKPGSSLDQGALESTQANPYSGGKKSLTVGPDFMPQYVAGVQNAFVSGVDASAGINLAPWTSLWLYNNASTVAWVALSTSAIASAPSSFATGVPLPPNAWTQLSMGQNIFIRTSAATVGVYTINDDTTVRAIDPNA
jgi:hypothetical protein